MYVEFEIVWTLANRKFNLIVTKYSRQIESPFLHIVLLTPVIRHIPVHRGQQCVISCGPCIRTCFPTLHPFFKETVQFNNNIKPGSRILHLLSSGILTKCYMADNYCETNVSVFLLPFPEPQCSQYFVMDNERLPASENWTVSSLQQLLFTGRSNNIPTNPQTIWGQESLEIKNTKQLHWSFFHYLKRRSGSCLSSVLSRAIMIEPGKFWILKRGILFGYFEKFDQWNYC
jgi:hypothetical protein